MFEKRFDCCGDVVMSESRIPWNSHSRKAKNLEIATELSRTVMHVLKDTPPSAPLRGEPMVFAFTSRKRQRKVERARLKGIQRRYREKMYRRGCMERERRRYVDEGGGEESSEEEHIESDGGESSREKGSEQVLGVIHIV